jgi:DNA-binding response OmpR family regulator
MQKNHSQHRILVVDDNQDAAELLQMVLQFQDYDVRIAFDGVSGLALAADFRPHVTCSDLNMPGLTGFDLALELRKSDHSSTTHLIAMTGLDTNDNYARAINAGFDKCFSKPFNIEEFTDYLESVFSEIEKL